MNGFIGPLAVFLDDLMSINDSLRSFPPCTLQKKMEGQLWVLRLTSPLMKKFSVNTNFFFLYERHGLTILPLMRTKIKRVRVWVFGTMNMMIHAKYFCVHTSYLITKQKSYNNDAFLEFKPNKDLLTKHSWNGSLLIGQWVQQLLKELNEVCPCNMIIMLNQNLICQPWNNPALPL